MAVLADSSIKITNNKMFVMFPHRFQMVLGSGIEIILVSGRAGLSWCIGNCDGKLRVSVECGSQYPLVDRADIL